MKRTKKRAPDFSKMSESHIIRWFDNNDTGEFIDENDIVDLSDDKKKAMLNVRLPRSVKCMLGAIGESKGFRGASTYARHVLTRHIQEAA